MKKSVITLVFVALLALSGAGVAKANSFTMDFTGVAHSAPSQDGLNYSFIDYMYADQGVIFSNALGVNSGSDYYLNQPSAGGALWFDAMAQNPQGQGGYAGLMNVAGGFTDYLSFYMAYAGQAGAMVTIYEQVGGLLTDNNNVLAQLYLDDFGSAYEMRDGIMYQIFEDFRLPFEGIARSVEFLYTIPMLLEYRLDSLVAFDNITLGGFGGNPVPEPATVLLMGAGLLGMLGMRRRFKK